MAIYFRSSVQNFDNWWFWIRKTNTLLNLIKEQDDIDKIYLYAKDLSEPKYKFLIKNAFIECSDTMYGVYENIDDYSPSRKRKF